MTRYLLDRPRPSVSEVWADTCDDWTMMGDLSLGSTGSTASMWTDWLVDECQFVENPIHGITQ